MNDFVRASERVPFNFTCHFLHASSKRSFGYSAVIIRYGRVPAGSAIFCASTVKPLTAEQQCKRVSTVSTSRLCHVPHFLRYPPARNRIFS
jgi:hypothetical protein